MNHPRLTASVLSAAIGLALALPAAPVLAQGIVILRCRCALPR